LLSVTACIACVITAIPCHGRAFCNNDVLRPRATQETQETPVYDTSGGISESTYTRGINSGAIRLARPMSMAQVLDHLQRNPYDLFMVNYVNNAAMAEDPQLLREALMRFVARPTPILAGVLVLAIEHAAIVGVDAPAAHSMLIEMAQGVLLRYARFRGAEALEAMLRAHPSANVRLMADRELYRSALVIETLFDLNRSNHTSLEGLAQELLLPPSVVVAVGEEVRRGYVSIADIVSMMPVATRDPSHNTGTGLRVQSPQATIARLEPIVKAAGGRVSSFSLGAIYGYGVSLPFRRTVAAGDNHYELESTVIAGGKGLDDASARASGLAEAVERYSATFASTQGYQERFDVRFGSAQELRAQGLEVLDPNTMALAYPYRDERLHWINAVMLTEQGLRTVYVPVQTVFIDANFSEPEIIGNGSNGLASGNTIAEARLHALLEILERDGDYTMFYMPSRCFQITAQDAQIKALLRACRKLGVVPEALDLTTEFGVPTYRVYAKDVDGLVMSGSGAHLDGRIAMARALCEFTAKLAASGRRKRFVQHPTRAASTRDYESLPNYSSGNIEEDLSRAETLLQTNGYDIIYANLTRADWQFPVARAIVPGLEITQGVASVRRVAHLLEDCISARTHSDTVISPAQDHSA